MKSIFTFCAVSLLFVCFGTKVLAQNRQILVDVGHGQKFYSDPADKLTSELVPTERLEYMVGELTKNAKSHNAEINYLKETITSEVLSKADLLFIHVPSIKYSEVECKAIHQFLENGGSLFIAVEEDYWATLEQVNANELVSPFGIKFSSNNPDQTVGGYSTPGTVTKKKYAIPFHGARLLDGGESFAFSDQSNPSSFAVFTEEKGGGKIIAMGEAMVSLYMTSWQDVNNYECAPFMQDVIGWLLK